MTRSWRSSRETPKYGWTNPAEISSEVAGTLETYCLLKDKDSWKLLAPPKVSPLCTQALSPSPAHGCYLSITHTHMHNAWTRPNPQRDSCSKAQPDTKQLDEQCSPLRAGGLGCLWVWLGRRSGPWGNSTAWRRGGRYTTVQIDSRKSRCLFDCVSSIWKVHM